MNHCVPDFEIDEDDSVTTSSALNRSKKSSMANEEIMELLWQNGQLVTHSQNQRSLKKSSQVVGGVSEQREIRSEEETTTSSQHQLFMQEDEMASWLQYPLDLDRDFYADLLYPPAGAPPPPPAAPVVSQPPRLAVTGALRPPVPPQRRLEPPVESRPQQQKYCNFSHFSRPKGRIQSGPSNLKESTTVESNETPMTTATTALESRVSCVADNATQVSGGNLGCSVTTAPTNTSPVTCDLTVTSSPGGSGASVSAEPSQKVTTATTTTTEDRKRKGQEADESECQSEDVEFESAHTKKQVCGSSTKRSRAAEVPNLSERRRESEREERKNDMLAALLAGDGGVGFSDEEIVDFLLALLVAGYETPLLL